MLGKNDAVLITGGTGSFGKTMLMELIHQDVGQIRIFSRDEENRIYCEIHCRVLV